MSGRVQDKVCVVTGAGSGIGRAVALRLAEEGGLVLAADVSVATAQQTAQIAAEAGHLGRVSELMR